MSVHVRRLLLMLQISALGLEILMFRKWVKYANEVTDGVIHSTQYYIEYVNRATLANFQCRISSPHALDFNMLVIFSLKMLNKATSSSLQIYMLAGLCI